MVLVKCRINQVKHIHEFLLIEVSPISIQKFKDNFFFLLCIIRKVIQSIFTCGTDQFAKINQLINRIAQAVQDILAVDVFLSEACLSGIDCKNEAICLTCKIIDRSRFLCCFAQAPAISCSIEFQPNKVQPFFVRIER